MRPGWLRIAGWGGRLWCASPDGAVTVSHRPEETCTYCRAICGRCGARECMCGDHGYELARLGGEVAVFLAETEPTQGDWVGPLRTARAALREAYRATVRVTLNRRAR